MLTRKKVLISCLLLGILIVLPNWNHFFKANPVHAAIAAHNVLHDSFEKDWVNIRQAIDPENKNVFYTINEFELLYQPSGDITSLSWSFESPVQADGKQWLYTINREEKDTTYTILRSKIDPQPGSQHGKSTMDEFLKLNSTKSIQTMNPHDADSVSMNFSPHYQKLNPIILQNSPRNSYFVLRDNKLIGPVKQGDGYVMTVFALQRQSDGSLSGENPHYYLLGGTGNVTLVDPTSLLSTNLQILSYIKRTRS